MNDDQKRILARKAENIKNRIINEELTEALLEINNLAADVNTARNKELSGRQFHTRDFEGSLDR